MEPSASITYNSLSGAGIFGQGWNLSGLSVIERSGESYFYDADNTDVSYTNDDVFLLDGVRLVLTSGTYGANGAIYAQESENFSKITSYGTAGSGPQYFEVKTKEGLTLQYGYTTDSRIEGIATGTMIQMEQYGNGA